MEKCLSLVLFLSPPPIAFWGGLKTYMFHLAFGCWVPSVPLDRYLYPAGFIEFFFETYLLCG